MSNNTEATTVCRCRKNHHSHFEIWIVLYLTVFGFIDCSGTSYKISNLKNELNSLKSEVHSLKMEIIDLKYRRR